MTQEVTRKQLDDINNSYYEVAPDDKGIAWSGCNYWVNSGENEYEPIGTATSMHDCNGCKDINECKAKRDTPVWIYNDEVEEFLKSEHNRLKSKRNQ